MQNGNKNNENIEKLNNEFNKNKLSWEKERNDLCIKSDGRENELDIVKSKFEREQLSKNEFLEQVKKSLSKQIDDNFKERYKI
jgi:hypothetical protein